VDDAGVVLKERTDASLPPDERPSPKRGFNIGNAHGMTVFPASSQDTASVITRFAAILGGSISSGTAWTDLSAKTFSFPLTTPQLLVISPDGFIEDSQMKPNWQQVKL